MDMRAATAEDIPAIRTLVAEVGSEFGFEPEPEGADIDLYGAVDAYFAPGGLLRVLTHDDRVVGVVGVVPHSASDWELRKIYVAAEHRGGGHGRCLLDVAVAFAQIQGARKLVLQSSSKLGAALILYERAGFVTIESGMRSSTCDVAMELTFEP